MENFLDILICLIFLKILWLRLKFSWCCRAQQIKFWWEATLNCCTVVVMTKCDGDGSDCHNDDNDDDGNGDYWLFFSWRSGSYCSQTKVQVGKSDLAFNFQHETKYTFLIKPSDYSVKLQVLLAAAYLDDACTGCHMEFQPTVIISWNPGWWLGKISLI